MLAQGSGISSMVSCIAIYIPPHISQIHTHQTHKLGKIDHRRGILFIEQKLGPSHTSNCSPLKRHSKVRSSRLLEERLKETDHLVRLRACPIPRSSWLFLSIIHHLPATPLLHPFNLLTRKVAKIRRLPYLQPHPPRRGRGWEISAKKKVVCRPSQRVPCTSPSRS